MHPLQIADASQVGAARRAAVELAQSLGFDEATTGRVSVIVTEAGTNLVKHGRGGHLVLGVVEEAGRSQLEIVALDRGPGNQSEIFSARAVLSRVESLIP